MTSRTDRLAPIVASMTALLVASGSAFAQDEPTTLLRTRSLAATCAQCHGTEGRAIAGTAVPGLAGLPAPYFTEQMKAFKSGVRTGSVMPQLAKGYSDAQIDVLAAYFANPPPAPKK